MFVIRREIGEAAIILYFRLLIFDIISSIKFYSESNHYSSPRKETKQLGTCYEDLVVI